MKKQNKQSKFVSPTLMWIIVVVGIIILFYLSPKDELFSKNYFTILLATLLIIYWVFMFSWSIKFHKEAPLSTLKISKLIKDGPYRLIRHPIYSADIVLGFGIFLLFPTLKYLFSFLWLAIILFLWMRLEENSLIKKFGKEYQDYIKNIPMFIPKITQCSWRTKR